MISKNQFLRAPKSTGRAHSQSPSQPQLLCAPQGDLKPGSPRGQKASAPDLCLRGRQGKLSPGTAIPSCAPL